VTSSTRVLIFYLLFSFRPDLVPYNKLSKANPISNLNNAFNTAEEKLGIASLLDAEGTVCCRTVRCRWSSRV